MKDRDLVEAFLKGARIDTSNDYDLHRKVDLLESVRDDDPLTMLANLLGVVREKEKAIATSMAQAQDALNLDGRSAA